MKKIYPSIIIASVLLLLLNSGCSSSHKQSQKESEVIAAESSSESQNTSEEEAVPTFDAITTLSGLNLSEMERTKKEVTYYGYVPHYKTIYKTKIDKAQLEYDANGYLLLYWDWAVFPGYVAKESIPDEDIIDIFLDKFSNEIPHLDAFKFVSKIESSDSKELFLHFERFVSDGIKDTISLHTASDGTIFKVQVTYTYLTEVSDAVRQEARRLFLADRGDSLVREIEPYEVTYSYFLFEDYQIQAVVELRFYDLSDPSVCTFVETDHFWIDPASLLPGT